MEAEDQVVKTSVFFWGFLVKQKQHPIPTIVKGLEGKNIDKVSSGGFFFIAANTKGELWGWGSAKYHRFGVQGEFIQAPKIIPLKFKVNQISAGNWHSMVTTLQGNAYGTGHNKYGSCGVGTFQNVSQFTKTLVNDKIKTVSCGDGFSLLLTTQGKVLSCGHHEFHGHPKKDNIHTPLALKHQEEFSHISAGFTHSLAVTKSGKVYSWGDGTFYQLGHGNKNSHHQEPTIISKLEQVKIVSSSCSRGQKNAHSMAISDTGQVYSWGAGYKGKLGHADEWTHADSADEHHPRLIKHIQTTVKKAGGGGIHSTLLSTDGYIYSFGCGSDGRLGHPQSTDHKYLYRQGYPKKIEALQNWNIIDLSSSYYHNIVVGTKRNKN